VARPKIVACGVAAGAEDGGGAIARDIFLSHRGAETRVVAFFLVVVVVVFEFGDHARLL
jgi:hypothetical protein